MNIQDVTTIALIGNVIFVAANFLALMYRIKIERFQIRLMEKNTIARQNLINISNTIRQEKQNIKELTTTELQELLDSILQTCEEVK